MQAPCTRQGVLASPTCPGMGTLEGTGRGGKVMLSEEPPPAQRKSGEAGKPRSDMDRCAY